MQKDVLLSIYWVLTNKQQQIKNTVNMAKIKNDYYENSVAENMYKALAEYLKIKNKVLKQKESQKMEGTTKKDLLWDEKLGRSCLPHRISCIHVRVA